LFGRVERGVGLLVSLSTLAATLLAVVSIQQVRSEQHINEEGQITDRYNAAGDQLGSSSIDVRLTGIYALQRIMQDSPRDQPTIVNVLCSYIRTHAALPNDQAPAVDHEPTKHGLPWWPVLAADVAAALKAIGDRNPELDGSSVVDLSDTDLSGAQLDHAHLPRAVLDGARLTGADLTGADLVGVSITDADLRKAFLRKADMRQIGLANTDLEGTYLGGADLRKALDLQRENLLDAIPNRFTKLPPRLARDPQIIQRQREND
jgi:hypothetical protein